MYIPRTQWLYYNNIFLRFPYLFFSLLGLLWQGRSCPFLGLTQVNYLPFTTTVCAQTCDYLSHSVIHRSGHISTCRVNVFFLLFYLYLFILAHQHCISANFCFFVIIIASSKWSAWVNYNTSSLIRNLLTFRISLTPRSLSLFVVRVPKDIKLKNSKHFLIWSFWSVM